ncbi:hypothetical protein [Caldalkalibacillus mannanilyticus]|uniref:hypothetical protein n=1 Tax=Caldalkalibacillus mannanilyticus TaxID=1418 RepID=UPI0004688327|nr:hypothetical protein [Caldalkalibacillus mannanilyticus]
MKLPITVSKLEKMKLFARGNPQKIAEYTSANQKFMELITTYFDDEYPYTLSPSELYLKKLEEEASTGDAQAIMRYELIRDRVEYNNAKNNQSKNMGIIRQGLMDKLQNKEPLSNRDLRLAEEVARTYSNAESRVLYATIKKALESPSTSETKDDDRAKSTKITQEEVDRAYEKAKETSKVDDRVAYVKMKKEFVEQDVKEHE